MTGLRPWTSAAPDHGALSGKSFVAFCAVGALTLLICALTGPDSDHLEEFYTGYGAVSPLRSGLSIAGDYISAFTVLGTGGVIALCGYDGVMLALSTALSLVVVVFLLAEPMRRAGRFTMGDVLAHRLPKRSVRVASGVVTVVALLPMMLVQLADMGRLMAYLLGFSDEAAKTGCVVGLGLLMIMYAAIGGAQGTAVVQALKTVILVGSGIAVAALVLHRFDWDPGALFDAAARHSGVGPLFLRPGLEFGTDAGSRLDMVVSCLTVLLGAACLPHNTMRMYAAPGALHLRRSMSWAASIVALFMLIMMVVGFGATAMLGRGAIAHGDPQGNTAYLLGSRASLGSHVSTAESLLFMLVTTAIVLTVLTSVAGMVLACANALAHDVLATRHQGLTSRREMNLARLSALGIGVPTVAMAALWQQHSLLPLAILSICLGASAIAPALVYGLFWRRYTSTGLMATFLGGVATVLVLAPGTRLISGTPFSVFPAARLDWFPFTTTGIVSVPAGFFFGWLGTVLSDRARGRPTKQQDARRRPEYHTEEALSRWPENRSASLRGDAGTRPAG
ncbi:cation acetate symporter [Streptomyces gramineus]|uniref:sodium/solute symporter n=1 Tax=Streptomyces gramineus TaxID=910542 RepID=UPI00398B7490